MLVFDWFVLPFTLGLVYLVVTLLVKYFRWVKNLPVDEFAKVKKGVLSTKTFSAIREVFLESLLHRKIFKVNPLLGYMHTSLAFGWFLLILIGNWESRIFYHGHVSPPYVPIFFRFFNPHPVGFKLEAMFSFLMDLTLLVVLSGVTLAWLKRMRSRFFGMKKTTVLHMGDRFALASLWFIFPMRFLAESFTSGAYGGGHFLTANSGAFFAGFLPVESLVYPAWWAYSLALGTFFVALPMSRYMHIPTEIVLIFLRKYGVSEQSIFTSYTQVEINSCSRCGICIDPCQLASSANIRGVQSVYHLQSIRNCAVDNDKSLNCLMCGRCDNVCPVGIDIASIRKANRKQQAAQKENVYRYVPEGNAAKADVIFFAGCMTHLQPSVKKAMTGLLKHAGISYWFMDESGSVCCGRPLMLAGKEAQARELMANNKAKIVASGAKLFVTSCPICYKVFKEEYGLNIEVMHHSEYLLQLVESKKILVNRQDVKAVYHDPCELGRGAGIYAQPRQLLKSVVSLQPVSQDKENALCCGGSLANIKISNPERKMITADAVSVLTANNPDVLVTGCPMCKRTFAQASSVRVLDIAEVLSGALVLKQPTALIKVKNEERLAIQPVLIR
ncbi:MAG: (Fe-S)-binding protein [Bacteroidota bacterium]|nr:(Fe-S)-binding protein [Bacteroidota bacterium]